MTRTRRLGDDSGMAMVLVMGSMVTLMVLVLAGLAYVMQSERFARHDQDYSSAMSAAQAGIDDYVSQLNRDERYYTSLDCDNAALQGPTAAANACGWGASTAVGWQPVSPGDSGADSPHFHYTVDARKAMTEGTVMVTSTGRSKGVYRTIEAAVGKGGSTDFVYYTDFESADPANKISYASGAPHDSCGRSGNSLARYFWQGRDRECAEITFIANDRLDGRVFSNDSILSNNAQFQLGIESANPGCQSVTAVQGTWRNCLRSGSTARFGKQPQYSSALYLQDNSAEFATYPGCHYYGATRIIFSADSKMRVWSKDSGFAGATLSVPSPEGVTPDCGTVAALVSDAGALVDVPQDMVVYVAAAPTPKRQLYVGEIGGPSGQTLPLGTMVAADRSAPTSNDSYTYDLNMTEPTRHKGEGNLYLEGVLNGRVTVAAEQSVIVTGDVVLAGGKNGDDMLGLVATNSVEVMHPRMVTVASVAPTRTRPSWTWGTPAKENEAGSSDYRADGTWPKRYADPTGINPAKGIQIAGSIQTLQHSFYVQRYNAGPKQGTLLVSGSIAQRWRGAVGTAQNNGYDKLYTYDQRLKYSAPPYFPHWANSEWSSRYSGELQTPDEVKNG